MPNPFLDRAIGEDKAREEKATKGPWKAVSSLPKYAVAAGDIDVVTATGREYRRVFPCSNHGSEERDAEFIAASRTWSPIFRTMLTRALEIMHNVCACGQLNDEHVCVPCEVKREWELIAKEGLGK